MFLVLSTSLISFVPIDGSHHVNNGMQGVWRELKSFSTQMSDVLREYQEVMTPQTIQLTTVGDIMMHEPQISSGYDVKTKNYNYEYMYQEVAPYLKEGDLTIGNLELTLAGEAKKYTGYPQFNAPDAVADALKAAGFDVLTTANNHSLDRRFEGVKRTIDVLDERGLLHTGTYRTQEESKEILIQEVKGTKIAFLAYTYGTNGIKVDKGKEYSVNYINKDKIVKDIKEARLQEAEVICASVHFGVEYMRTPNQAQKDLVDLLVDNGVDIILGSQIGRAHV